MHIEIPRKTKWIGRAISYGLGVFLLIDGGFKVVRPTPILEFALHLGYSDESVLLIGLLLITCTITYLVPRTSILGAILLTGYFGGALASHLRVEDGIFPMLFVIAFGILTWIGLYLRDHRVRALLGAP